MKAFARRRNLQQGPYPLVIFPEGEVYHINERITPFRRGAAAIASRPRNVPSAGRVRPLRNQVPILGRPDGQAAPDLMDRLERRSSGDREPATLPLAERIYRFAEAAWRLRRWSTSKLALPPGRCPSGRKRSPAHPPTNSSSDYELERGDKSRPRTRQDRAARP